MLSTDILLIDDVNTFKGHIPDGYDLVEYENGTDPVDGVVLYGFDEVGLSLVPNPSHAFVKLLM